jgi:small-conductance mechanosensitive channel
VDTLREWLAEPGLRWLASGVAILVAAPLSWLVAGMFLRVLARVLRIDLEKPPGLLYRRIKRSLFLWMFLLAAYGILQLAPLGFQVRHIATKVLLVGFTISLTIFLANLAAHGIRAYGKRHELALPMTSLTENIARLAVLVVGFLLVLSNVGVQITPLLTALGIGSLAVALALQDTLTGLFSGFYLVASRDFQPGDYVQVVGGREGYIVDIGWRHTHIRELAGNLILVPNAELVKATVVNTYHPSKDLAVLVQVGVGYGSDLEHVERVTVEVARDVQKTVKGGVAEFEPFIRYHTLGDSAIQFTTILRAKEFTDQFLIKHEFIKRLTARYRAEGIEIPFPQRVVHRRESAQS